MKFNFKKSICITLAAVIAAVLFASRTFYLFKTRTYPKLLLESEGRYLDGIKVAIQGMGNVGANAARIFYHRGIKIVAVSDIDGGLYCEEGLNIQQVSQHIPPCR